MPEELVKYLGLRINAMHDWVAMLDWGAGPTSWDVDAVTDLIANQISNEKPVPKAFWQAQANLLDSNRQGVLMYHQEAKQ